MNSFAATGDLLAVNPNVYHQSKTGRGREKDGLAAATGASAAESAVTLTNQSHVKESENIAVHAVRQQHKQSDVAAGDEEAAGETTWAARSSS